MHYILLSISLIIGVLALYTFFHRKTEFGNTYFLLLIAIFIYTLGYFFEIQSTSVEYIYFWLRFEYIGISWFPTIFLVLAFQYTGNNVYLKNWIIVILIIISATTQILQFTDWNHLFYTEFNIDKNSLFLVADFKKGPWYWVHQVYSNISFLISSVVYLNMMLSSVGLNKIRSGIMFLSAVIPWFVYVAYLLDFNPYKIDFNPFSVAFVGILATLGIFKFQLLEFKPLALESIFKNMSEGVIIVDNQKKLLLYNDKVQQIFPSINNKNIGVNIIPILSRYLDTNLFFNQNPDEPFEFSITDSGNINYYQMKWSVMTENSKKTVGIAIIISDITNRKEIEKKLEKNALELKELNQYITRFLTILGHDLKNPLNILLNFSDILNSELDGKVEKPIKEISQLLYETASSMCFLTENLLKWSRLLNEGVMFNPKKGYINPLIKEELRLINTQKIKKNINITTNLAPDIQLSFDKDMIRTILRNLVTNALKFSYANGEIQIVTYLKNREFIVEVIDHGIGIKEDEIENIFKVENLIIKKGTDAETGSGLGLIVCKEFVTKHKGEISVISSPGEGSKFWFSLPV